MGAEPLAGWGLWATLCSGIRFRGLSSPAGGLWSVVSPLCASDFLAFLCTWHRAVSLAWPLLALLYLSGTLPSWNWTPGLPWPIETPSGTESHEESPPGWPLHRGLHDGTLAVQADGASSAPCSDHHISSPPSWAELMAQLTGLSHTYTGTLHGSGTQRHTIFASFHLAHFCLKNYACTACVIYIFP